MSDLTSTRRDLLTGQALRAHAEVAQNALADAVTSPRETPSAGPTVRLAVKAMATEFGVLMNPGPADQVWTASHALDLIGGVEQQLTVYRNDSEVSRINATAADKPYRVEPNLFELLTLCRELTELTEGAFDAATQAQILLWHHCRREERLPTDDEVAAALEASGMRHVKLDAESLTVRFTRPRVGFNFGAIGKGYALDRCAEKMLGGEEPEVRRQESEDGSHTATTYPSPPPTLSPVTSFCIHGGHSSVLARGEHQGHDGWPVGLGNPLFTTRRLGTILLRDQALGTSGSNIQFYRHSGKRYGHILDPRTARPAEELLSVSVIAPTAAMADALSTAFFVLGVEKARAVCDNSSLIGALLIPPPDRGGRLRPVICGISEDSLFLDPEQVTATR